MDPREEVEESVRKERRRGAEASGSFGSHRTPILPTPFPARNPQTAETRIGADRQKCGDLRKCVVQGAQADAMIGSAMRAEANTRRTGGTALTKHEDRAMQMADAIGLARRRESKRRKGRPSCLDCFFHCQGLCALDLDEPCSTFRPNTADGLVPPRQPSLLLRQPPTDAAIRAA
jgi:hypothetical protein